MIHGHGQQCEGRLWEWGAGGGMGGGGKGGKLGQL